MMESLLNTFRTLSDETRVRILLMLYHKTLCVCELCEVLEETQPKISKHLGKLRDMGFVIDQRREQFVFYQLNNENQMVMNILSIITGNIEYYLFLKKDIERLSKKNTNAWDIPQNVNIILKDGNGTSEKGEHIII